ncbi:hypothetical protein HK102_013472, partial [Quaeritorhiza haematococci]
MARLRTHSNRLVFYMSVADLFGSIFLFLAKWPMTLWQNEFLCTVQGAFVQVFVTSAMFWTAIISAQCLMAIMQQKPVQSFRHLEPIYHALAWGLPTLMVVIMYGVSFRNPERGPIFGDATLWCWISGNWNIYRLIFFYIPLWLIFIFNLFVYVYVGKTVWLSTKRIRQTATQASHGLNPDIPNSPMVANANRTIQRYARKTSFYLLAFFINWLFGTINRIENQFGKPIFALFVLHA